MNKILNEEEYLGKINEIIEADYFPDKKKLGLLNNLIEAEESGNNAVIKATKELLCNRDFSHHISLDLFLSQCTSEDNLSFMKLQEESSRQTAEKYWWIAAVPKGMVILI